MRVVKSAITCTVLAYKVHINKYLNARIKSGRALFITDEAGGVSVCACPTVISAVGDPPSRVCGSTSRIHQKAAGFHGFRVYACNLPLAASGGGSITHTMPGLKVVNSRGRGV